MQPLHVSLIAIPDAVVSTLSGIYDVLNAFEMLAGYDDAIPAAAPFEVDIVAAQKGPVTLASGLSIEAGRGIGELASSDIVIVPSVLLGDGGWQRGRYPDLVEWLTARHAAGAILCSACSGVFLLAETGLFDGHDTTVHWGYARAFRAAFPQVPTSPERVLIASGPRHELVSSGAAQSWHDLVLYLIARFVSAPAAQSVARFFALQWHRDGMAPYMRFDVPRDHGDASIAEAQAWLETHFAVANPVEGMVKRSGLSARTFNRRFNKATGHTPLTYVQKLRIEDAKRRLERTTDSVEQISFLVGYEDASYFRRLFRRLAGVAPASYRRKFQVPEYSESGAA